LDNSWTWNAWFVEGSLNPVRLCARLLVPRGLETHMLVFQGDPENNVWTIAVPAGTWATAGTFWFTPTGGHFPYGIEVDQSELVIT
jgi:hypothetical protein